MPANMTIFPAGTRRRVAQAVSSAAVGAKGAAGCTALLSEIGANPRLRIRNGATIVLDVVFQGALTASNGIITLPQYTTLNTLIDATISAGWVMRIGRADDAVYVEGAVGNAASSAPFKLSNNPDDNKGFSIGAVTIRFDPAIDNLPPSSGGGAFSVSDVLEAMNGPSEARIYGWGSYGNDPANVTFVGGNNAGKEGPGVNYAGPQPRGSINPAWWKADPNVRADYKDADPWNYMAGLGIVAERAPLNNAFQSLHNQGSNVAVAFRRHLMFMLRASNNQYVVFRNSTVHDFFWTDAVSQLYLEPQPPLQTRPNPDGGTIVKWPTFTRDTLHMYWQGPSTLPVESARINFSSLFNDCAAIGYAVEIRLVDWDSAQSSQLSGAQLGGYIGADAYPEANSIVGGGGAGPGDNRPGIATSRNYLLTPSWRWWVAMTGRDFGRQDHTGGSGYGGITAAQLQSIGLPAI
jgi:hypothetical protein